MISFLMGLCISSSVFSLTLENKAKNIIIYHCGSCHTPGLTSSNERALKIFNLNKEAWFGKMSKRQLLKSKKMLTDRRDLNKAELEESFIGSKFKARKPTKDEIITYGRFVDEIAP